MLLSNLQSVEANLTSPDIRSRNTLLALVLGEEAEAHNGKTVEIRAQELVGDTVVPYLATSVTLQRGFGGFFDPL
ncbi:MAG TPA: hypothetical protein VIW24_04365 [Aldersonia sp.]